MEQSSSFIPTLNLGCGETDWGDIRADIVKTKTSTIEFDFNKKFPIKSNSVGLIKSKSVLEHIRNIDNFMSEIYRIMKKGAECQILTDNASYIGFHLNNHQDYIKYIWNTQDYHYYLFKEEHLKNLASQYNFRLMDITYSYPKKGLWFIPNKYKCMHITLRIRK